MSLGEQGGSTGEGEEERSDAADDLSSRGRQVG